MSDEQKKKLSEYNKSMGIRPPSRKGAKLTPEQRKKLSLSRIGKKRKPMSEQGRRNIGLAGIGRVVSEETRAKFRKRTPYWLGKKRSEEDKRKMSLAKKGMKWPEWVVNNRRRFTKRGEQSPQWKGGIYPLVLLLRSCYKYRQWRSDVFTRDNFTCILCGERGGKLNADHIKPFSLIFEENNLKDSNSAFDCDELWDINNGRTLCFDCHRKITQKQHKDGIFKNAVATRFK